MILTDWNELHAEMKNDAVRRYYDILSSKKGSLLVKRCFDAAAAFTLLALLSPLFAGLAAAVRLDSPGPAFYRQKRVTRDGREFRLHKFRSMRTDADKGLHLTSGDDPRITKTGRFIRKYKLDELPQLIDVLKGDMTFVGTRPEVPEYVSKYTPEMFATLLIPAGITSKASVIYKDESSLMSGETDTEKVYLEKILPDKMRCNLSELEEFSLLNDLRVMLDTVAEVFRQ